MKLEALQLEMHASLTDDACEACRDTDDHATQRRHVSDHLEALTAVYSDKGINTEVYKDAYQVLCDNCLENGRTGELTNRFTCGIRVGIWEE